MCSQINTYQSLQRASRKTTQRQPSIAQLLQQKYAHLIEVISLKHVVL